MSIFENLSDHPFAESKDEFIEEFVVELPDALKELIMSAKDGDVSEVAKEFVRIDAAINGLDQEEQLKALSKAQSVLFKILCSVDGKQDDEKIERVKKFLEKALKNSFVGTSVFLFATVFVAALKSVFAITLPSAAITLLVTPLLTTKRTDWCKEMGERLKRIEGKSGRHFRIPTQQLGDALILGQSQLPEADEDEDEDET